MNEKEIKRYQKYLKKRDKANWLDRIRYWRFLKKDYDAMQKENGMKQNKISQLKQEISSQNITISVANERIEQYENDLKKKRKKKIV